MVINENMTCQMHLRFFFDPGTFFTVTLNNIVAIR